MPFNVKLAGSLESYLKTRNVPASDIKAAAAAIKEANDIAPDASVGAGVQLTIPDQLVLGDGRRELRVTLGDLPSPAGCGAIPAAMDADVLDRLSFTRLSLATGRGSVPYGCGSYASVDTPVGCGSYASVDTPVGCGSYASVDTPVGCGSYASVDTPVGCGSYASVDTPVGCGSYASVDTPVGCGGEASAAVEAPSGCGAYRPRRRRRFPTGC